MKSLPRARVAPLLVLALGAPLFNGCTTPRAPADAAPRALPPPTRPTNLLVAAHFGHPRESVRALGTLAGQNVPFEIGMSLVLGFDSTMIAAVDLSKPIDMIVTGTPDEREVTLAFVPSAPASLGSTLSTRFRLVRTEGVGEVLTARTPGGRDGGWKCAVVGVQGPVPSRLVCSTADRALAQTARWVAQESARRAEEMDDAVFEVDGDSARQAFVPYFRRVIDQGGAMLGAAAQQARDDRPTPPDLGDPEPLANRIRAMATQVEPMFADLRRFVVKLEVQPTALVIDAHGELSADGTSVLTRGTLRAVDAPRAHPLTARLAPDALAAGGLRNPPDATREHLRTATRAILDVLGSRIPSPELATADLDALFANTGDGLAFALSEAPAPTPARPARAQQAPAEPASPSYEFSVVASQTDQGQGALGVIGRLARAPWLRGMRIGDAPATITAQRNAVFVRLPPRRPPALINDRPGGLEQGQRAQRGPAPTPSEVTIAVSGEQLAVLVGPNGRDQLRRLDARTAGAAPSVLGAASEGPFVAGADVGRIRGANFSPLRLAWTASREGSTLTSRFQLNVPGAVLRMLRRAGPPGAGGPPPPPIRFGAPSSPMFSPPTVSGP
ncbi:MAG: hypothetical protein JNK05_24345 [Myxococcales bacterium]|nr:hypothetical protein [Myxococcales bacterium]